MSDLNGAAGKRISSLLDANSFVEIGGGVTARSTDFNMDEKKAPSDGVITGYGTVGGNLVYVYSQDAAVLGGTIGEMHARKIVNIYKMAMKTGAPVVGLIDCGGVRLQESTDALDAVGSIYMSEVMASGVIPQITAVFGSCGGGLSVIPALSDFSFVESSKGRVFVNTPDAIIGNTIDKCDTAAASYQAEKGNVDFVGTEEEVFANMRALLALLPCNNEDDGEIVATNDDPNRAVTGIDGVTAAGQLALLADNGAFMEVKKDFATSMITGFMRMNGVTVGAVANNDKELRGRGAAKAASFIKFCDAYGIPVVTLVNVEKFSQSKCGEITMPKSAASLVYAYADATVPKVTVVTGKAYGTPYVVMGSKSVGADMVYAWPKAEIGVMDAKAAAKILYADADAETLKEGAAKFSSLQQSVSSAAARGYVDTIIDPQDTRKYVIGALEMLYTKREDRPVKKHGTV
ncbi:MAG: carboxyl transferase domain-containing protein [Lachnospiraceae bacterium]|nr:carboxyl transferase domain-containing protein [Lachnospiraceae bacterium]